MAKLDDRVKQFIVQALACYDTPTQVAAAVKEEFGLTITRMHVQTYQPGTAAGRDLSKRWRDLFDATRKAFLEDAASVPIAQQSYRLRRLQQLHDLAAARNNAQLAAALLEQAAKEVGGAFTNTRKLGGEGPPGTPIPVKSELVHTLSDADLARIAAGGGD